jgi:2-polyprenyl-3-methyl-5-hydroxy-6-metoxy-1,4-benzoquinol methylase
MNKNFSCPSCSSSSWATKFTVHGWLYVSCNSCGILRTEHIPTELEIETYYKEKSQHNSKHSNYDLSNQRQRQSIARQIAFKVDMTRIGRVFDIGCLDGLILDEFKSSGWITYGLELQTRAVNHCISKGHIVENNLFEKADAISTLTGSFDVVIISGVIEHVRNPNELLRSAFALLKPNGILLIQTPDYGSILSKILGKYWFCIAPVEHIFCFTRKSLNMALFNNGFTVVKTSAHIKFISLNYLHHVSATFGPWLHVILCKILIFIPKWINNIKFPLYGGEMIVIAKKNEN